MNKITIIVIISIFVLILLQKIYIISLNYNKLEHLTQNSDEAIQNVASLYNKDKFSIGKLRLGDKWVLSGVDGSDVFKVYKADGTLAKIKAGSISAEEISDLSMNGPVKVYIDSQNKEVVGKVDTKLSTTTDSLKGYVTTEINDMSNQVKEMNEQVKKQDLSNMYQNGQVSADKVLLGKRWLLVGGDDNVIRIHRTDGSGLAKVEFGNFTSAELYDKSMNGAVKSYVDNKNNEIYKGLDSKFTNFSSNLDGKVNTMSSNLDGKMNELSSNLDGKVNALSSNLDGKVNELSSNLDGKVNELSSNLDGKITQMDTKLSQLDEKINNSSTNTNDKLTSIAKVLLHFFGR